MNYCADYDLDYCQKLEILVSPPDVSPTTNRFRMCFVHRHVAARYGFGPGIVGFCKLKDYSQKLSYFIQIEIPRLVCDLNLCNVNLEVSYIYKMLPDLRFWCSQPTFPQRQNRFRMRFVHRSLSFCEPSWVNPKSQSRSERRLQKWVPNFRSANLPARNSFYGFDLCLRFGIHFWEKTYLITNKTLAGFRAI